METLRGRDVVRKLVRRLAALIALGAAALIIATLATARRGNPALYPPVGPVVAAFVVSNGYHSGIAVRREALSDAGRRQGLAALTMIASRFSAYDWIEIGYGEAEFYRSVPTVAAMSLTVALRALFRPGNAAVLHVAGLTQPPPVAFPDAEMVRLQLSDAGFLRLAGQLDHSFAPASSGLPADELGRGLYGPSLFFRATGTFHAFHLCNHWVASMLDAAGVPTAPVFDTVTQGLLLDLRWRAGATRPAPEGTMPNGSG